MTHGHFDNAKREHVDGKPPNGNVVAPFGDGAPHEAEGVLE